MHVVGLGPAGADLVTTGVVRLVERVGGVQLRTTRHPAASLFAGAPSFDDVYDTAERIDDVYPEIVERLVAQARDAGEVVYAVPGSPAVAERTVELLLRDRRVETELHPAVSFLEVAWLRLRIDPVELGVRLVDGHRFETEAAGERGPLLVAQCDHRFVLSDIKLAVEDPPDVEVTLLHHLGLADEAVLTVPWSELDRTLEPDHLTSVYLPELARPLGAPVARLVATMSRLRTEDPWKASQTHRSLQRYLLEESYETLEAIDRYDPDSGDGAEQLCAELGDLLYQVVFHSTLAAEAGWFTLGDVVEGLDAKLERRHPHVFAPEPGAAAPGIDELVARWEAAKAAESPRSSVLDGIPATLPALARAMKVLERLGRASIDVGPSGPAPAGVGAATAAPPSADELGAALLEVVGRAVASGLDPEDALRRSTDALVGTGGCARGNRGGAGRQRRPGEKGRRRVSGHVRPPADRSRHRPARHPHPRDGGGGLDGVRRGARHPGRDRRPHRVPDPDGTHPPRCARRGPQPDDQGLRAARRAGGCRLRRVGPDLGQRARSGPDLRRARRARPRAAVRRARGHQRDAGGVRPALGPQPRRHPGQDR